MLLALSLSSFVCAQAPEAPAIPEKVQKRILKQQPQVDVDGDGKISVGELKEVYSTLPAKVQMAIAIQYPELVGGAPEVQAESAEPEASSEDLKKLTVAPPLEGAAKGYNCLFLGHSFFRPMASRMMGQHASELGIAPAKNKSGGPESLLVFAGGQNGHPLALLNREGTCAAGKAKLDEGKTELIGMTYFPETNPITGELIPELEGYDSIKGYRAWVEYAVKAGNPLRKVFIAMPWAYYPEKLSYEVRSLNMKSNAQSVLHPIIDGLRAEFPQIEFMITPYGQGAFELEKMFDNGELAEDGITQKFGSRKGPKGVSIYNDTLGHGSTILVALSELIWLYSVFDVDLDEYDYDTGYKADLKSAAKRVVDKYPKLYSGK